MTRFVISYEAQVEGVEHRTEQATVVSALDIEEATETFLNRIDTGQTTISAVDIIVASVDEIWENTSDEC